LVNAKEAILPRKTGGAKISIGLHRREHEAVLEIRDNGGGIDEGILQNIFDPYYTTKDYGSGIGLYMTKTIIERNMKGRIMAANHEDGAEFRVYIPILAKGLA
jgi:signal transduction histidine kinase